MMINIRIIILVLAQTFFITISAQRFGAKVDLSLARLNEPNKIQDNINTGFSAGGLIEIKIINQFYIQPEVLLIKKGTFLRDYDMDLDYRLYYVELPLKFKYNISTKKGCLAAFFGPYIGYGISGRVYNDMFENDIKYFDLFKSNTTDVDPTLSRFDAGITTGLSYEFKNGFYISTELKPGLLSIMFNKDLILTNQCLSLGVGYIFK